MSAGAVDVHQVCGLSCFNCDEESPSAPTRQAMEEAAYHAGWVLGLRSDANAYYACSECAVILLCGTPAWPLHWTARQRADAARAKESVDYARNIAHESEIAIAAFAELIEAAKEVDRVVNDYETSIYDRLNAYKRLSAALARVGGAK